MRSDVGIDPERPLTRIVGDVTVTSPGTTFDGIDFCGRLQIRAAGVRLRNCRVRGARIGSAAFPTTFRPLVDTRHSACVDFLAENCHFEPDDAHHFWESCISGINFTLINSVGLRTVDILRINGGSNPPTVANVHVGNNVLGWMGYFKAASPGIVHPSDDETHCDVLHIEGTDGVEIVDNSLNGYWAEGWGDQPTYEPDMAVSDLQVIQVNNRTGEPAQNIILKRNEINGGRIPVNLGGAAKVNASHHILTAHRNIFGGDAGVMSQTILADVTWSGTTGLDCGENTPLANRLMDINGPHIVVRRNG